MITVKDHTFIKIFSVNFNISLFQIIVSEDQGHIIYLNQMLNLCFSLMSIINTTDRKKTTLTWKCLEEYLQETEVKLIAGFEVHQLGVITASHESV